MIIQYIFNVEDEDDIINLKIFQQSKEMHRLIWEFSNNSIRNIELIEDEKQKAGYEKCIQDFLNMKDCFDVKDIY